MRGNLRFKDDELNYDEIYEEIYVITRELVNNWLSLTIEYFSYFYIL